MSKVNLAPILELIQIYHRSSDVKLLRNALLHIAESLHDLETVSRSLKSTKETGNYDFLLDLASKILGHFCEKLNSNPHPSPDELKACEVFIVWFISQMLQLLAHPGCEPLHGNVIRLVLQFLDILKWKEPFLYQLITSKLISSLHDLIPISGALYKGEVITEKLHGFSVPVELVEKSLLDPEEGSSDPKVIWKSEISVQGKAGCDMMQLNLTRVLVPLTAGVCQFNASLLSVLWACLCHQLHFGCIDLKVESLRIINRLLDCRGFPMLDVSEYFVECILALLEMLCAGSHWNHYLELLLRKVCEYLTVYGLGKLQTTDIKHSLGNILDHVLDAVPVGRLLSDINLPVLRQLKEALVKELEVCGSDTKRQFLVNPLTGLILLEIKGSEDEAKIEKGDDVNDANISGKHSRDSARIVRGEKVRRGGVYPEKQSALFKTLKEKLNFYPMSLAPSCGRDQMLQMLEGVRVIIEIILQSFLQYLKITTVPKMPFNNWLTEEEVSRFCLFWKQYLSICAELDDCLSFVNQSLVIVVKSIGSLLAVQEFLAFRSETLQDFTWILTLSWLHSDSSWLDLELSEIPEVEKIVSKLSSQLEADTVCCCIPVLCLLPREVASCWRLGVLRQTLLDPRIAVRKKGIRALPRLLHHLGPHLIEKFTEPLLGDFSSVEQQKTLASFLGVLSCVLAGKTVIHRPAANNSQELFKSVALKCSTCEELKPGLTSDNTSSQNVRKSVDPCIFIPYLKLLESEDVDVRKNFVESLSKIFSHVKMSKHNEDAVLLLNKSLSTISDEDYDIRMAFSKSVSHLVGGVEEETLSMNEKIVSKLKDVLIMAKLKKNIHLQETVLHTIGQLGRNAEGDLLLVVIISLMESMLSDVLPVASVAHEQLQEVSKTKKIEAQNLFMKFRQPICKFLVQAMHEAEMKGKGKTPELILRKVVNALNFSDIKSFLQCAERFLVPQLVSRATPSVSNLIKLVATLLCLPSRMKLLISNTKYIFSYLVRYCPKAELEKAIHFLQAETELELDNLLRIDFQRVHNELLFYLSSNYQQVFCGLKILSSYDENYKGPEDISTEEEMADYLQPRLLGVLAFFDSQLLIYSIPMEEKKLALESLISIINLMGPKHITTVRFKVMNTLRIGLQFKDRDFQKLSCRAWNSFVHSVDLSALKTMMSSILATLLPLFEHLPQEVAFISDFLIVENQHALSSYFHEVYFLPDIPELANTNAVLKQFSEGLSSQSSLKIQIDHSLEGINHESLDIRLHALSKLRKLLHDNQRKLQQFLLDNETADPIMSQLVSVLLSGCIEPDLRARCLYGECLGEIGAIDPGRLELTSNNPKAEMAKFQVSIDDDNFAVGLINEVVRAFLSATETRVQDCSSFALQCLLQIYEISDRQESEAADKRLWSRFPEHIQEILLPLLSSKYVLASTSDWSNLPKPIYQSRKGGNFKDWVSTWTGYLYSRVRPGKAYEVFKSCSAVIRHDTHIALYILPHIILQVLLTGTDDDMKEIHKEIMEVLSHVKRSETRHGSAADFRHMSAQTVFSVLDFLTKWRTYRAQIKAAEEPSTGEPTYLKDHDYLVVSSFLEEIPQELLAEACYICNAFTRAFIHFESFIRNKKVNIQEHLDLLQRLYVAMDEPDGVAGVAAVRQAQPTLVEQILAHQSIGQYQDAEACYERAVQLEPEEISHHFGWLQSLMELGQLNKALLHVNGVLAERPAWTAQLNAYRIEAAWKLGSWDKLESYVLKEKQNQNCAVGLGKILLAARDRKEDEFLHQLKIVREELMGPLSAASMESGSYQRGYEFIVRLHMLNEVEQAMKILLDFPSHRRDTMEGSGDTSLNDLLNQWDARLQMMQSSFRTKEPVLTLRRTLFALVQQADKMTSDRQIGKWCLCSATVAREAGYLQTAYGSLIQAASYKVPEFCLEKAKWLWEKGQNYQALSCLEKGMAEHFRDLDKLKVKNSEEAKLQKFTYAQILRLYSQYCEETSKMDCNTILRSYRQVTEVYPEWEDGYFYLAKYYDKMMTSLMGDNDRPVKQGEFIIYVVNYFGKSLQYGNQFIYQSMPRLLSLWQDYGSSVVDRAVSPQRLQSLMAVLIRLNKVIGKLSCQLAPYQFFTAFPQLISRICHAQPDVFQHHLQIIAKLLMVFPQQAVWMMMAVSKSSYTMRKIRCQEIFDHAKSMKEELNKFLQDANKLTERLLEVCERDFPNMHVLSISQHFKQLKRLLDDRKFSPIIVPLQSSMNVTLPTGSHKDHNPFPGKQVYIKGFEDTIEVLPSLQKPKRITIRGSDGRLYMMMCKPKDDLRKDCRLMDFNAIVNKLLRKDPEARKRQLDIRTYTVIPLNEECGIIEWVNNTNGLRHIIMKLYKEKGLSIGGRELKSFVPALQAPLESKMILYKKLLERQPAVFYEWFLRTFPDPTNWYNARLAYARTSAVMSMVGYILGLGDRHGENILFDSTTGDCVHVDFNCLFNKGETFEWPEKVPFRLTHNMVDAMGPMGYEGIFRQACEVTLRVMRNQMDPLMSILKPFIYDPLVEWRKTTSRQRSTIGDSGEITNELALTHVQNIEHRLKGVQAATTKPRSLPLSVEGHVNCLIQEATDEKLLCLMYIGWAAYL